MTIYRPPTDGELGFMDIKLVRAFEIVASARLAHDAGALTYREYMEYVNQARELMGRPPFDLDAPPTRRPVDPDLIGR